ncbi:MAG: hypothetical protein LC753_12450 [Acidobacteria bacterium]|nr:hypothetical protein [Acidobacteriota bacterium]MCA1651048.1 hypothetical protein [Acidobacteriota bacterium]
MSSPLEVAVPERRERRGADVFVVWNRRLHYFTGLYLLFFLLAVRLHRVAAEPPALAVRAILAESGSAYDRAAGNVPSGTSEVDRAHDLMRQLDVAGESQWPAAQPAGGPFAFQVSRPGLVVDVKVELGSDRASAAKRSERLGRDARPSHVPGVRAADTRNARHWMLTNVWAFSMDAVAAGLIVMVFSSYLMWYRLKAKRQGGVIALLLGAVTCGAFLGGVSWLL